MNVHFFLFGKRHTVLQSYFFVKIYVTIKTISVHVVTKNYQILLTFGCLTQTLGNTNNHNDNNKIYPKFIQKKIGRRITDNRLLR